MKYIVIIFLLLTTSPVSADAPDCKGWPTTMAFVLLKNAGITNNKKIDFDKTKTIRLASEKIGNDLYRQIHHITFTEKTGKVIEVISSNDASNEECSMSDVEVFIINKQLDG